MFVFIFLYGSIDWTTEWAKGLAYGPLFVIGWLAVSRLIFPIWLKVDRANRLEIWSHSLIQWSVVAAMGFCLGTTILLVTWRVYEIPYFADREVERLLPQRSTDLATLQTTRIDAFIKEIKAIGDTARRELARKPRTDEDTSSYQVIRMRLAQFTSENWHWLQNVEPRHLSFRTMNYSPMDTDNRASLQAALSSFLELTIEQQDAETGLHVSQKLVQVSKQIPFYGQRLLHWAELPNTTSRQIQQLISVVEQIDPKEEVRWWLEEHYRKTKTGYERGDGLVAYAAPWAFWEEYREGRLIKYAYQQMLASIDDVEAQLVAQVPIDQVAWKPVQYTLFSGAQPLGIGPAPEQLYRITFLRNATLLQLAVAAWRKDHEEHYPLHWIF